MNVPMKLWKKIIYSSLLSELDTTKGDGGWCIVPPLSVLYKYSHAYRRSYDCANLAIAPAASRNKCAFGQSSSYPRWRWRRRGWLSAAVNPVEPRGRQDLRLVTEPSGWDSLDGNHVHKSRNFYFIKDNELTSMTIFFEATDLHLSTFKIATCNLQMRL